MTSGVINLRECVAAEVQRLAIESLGSNQEQERWAAYESAKQALQEVCDDSQEYAIAVRAYVLIVGLHDQRRGIERKATMKVIFGILLFVPLIVVGSLRGCAEIHYQRTVGGHITNAAHANTIALARGQMQEVVTAMENDGMIGGFTSVIYRTPEEDVGYWYSNLKAARDDLDRVSPDSHYKPDARMLTPLEESNILLKLHETLAHTPDGIGAFPHNVAYCWAFVISVALAACGAFIVAVFLSEL